MGKTIALKSLLRAPLRGMLTFLLIGAASFALFSRAADYAVTVREAANAESFYHGVAGLDNSVPNIIMMGSSGNVGYAKVYEVKDKPWPTEGQLAEFASLPGVTLADTRYMTAGRIGGYKRLKAEEYSGRSLERFVVEGTYAGYEGSSGEGWIDILLDDVTVLASEMEIDTEKQVRVKTVGLEETGDPIPYPQAYFDSLGKGSRCLMVGRYDGQHGYLRMDGDEEAFCVLDGKPGDYLQTEAFAYYQGLVEAIEESGSVYDIVYTSDMRAIPRFNERNMAISQGRPLREEDTEACVVSELFLETNGLSVGDKVNVELGNKLFAQNPLYGAMADSAEDISEFGTARELEIIGAYRFMDTLDARLAERKWSYTPNTVFVSRALLPVEVPADYKTSPGEFSVLIENARDIEDFQEAAEPLAAEMGLSLRFSDGGWLGMKDSFEAGSLASLLTTALYLVGAALALFLAVYLYVGRNKKAYAMMRTLGVPGKTACYDVAWPLVLLSVLAMPMGGMAGLFYARDAAAKALAGMAASAPEGYHLNTALPIEVVLGCLFGELAFAVLVALVLLHNMRRTPPLELLQEGAAIPGARKNTLRKKSREKTVKPEKSRERMLIAERSKERAAMAEKGREGRVIGQKSGCGTREIVLAERSREGTVIEEKSREGTVKPERSIDMERISAAEGLPAHRKYSALRHVAAYGMRHMRRGLGKTVVSFVLAAVLAAGVGMFVLARLTYQDAYHEMDVEGRALDFSSSAISKLLGSELVEDVYCYGNFGVRTNGQELHTSMTVTNDPMRYLGDGCSVTYAEGYDGSVLEKTGPVCLMGQALARTLGIRPGEEVALLSETLYTAMEEEYGEGEELEEAAGQATKKYRVIGVVETEDAQICSGIFAGTNGTAESVYGQPFPMGYCEFTLAENEKLAEAEGLLEELKEGGRAYAVMASFYIDAAGLENVQRICALLGSLFPIAVGAALLVGLFGSALAILQAAQEAAILRILGTSRQRTRCMVALGQVFLCVAGIALVAGGLALSDAEKFTRSIETLAACWALYFLGCVCGASVVSIQVTRRRILDLLQGKE